MSAARYPMKFVTQRTGLSPHVLRVWERRYGAVQPDRTESNRRQYGEDDVARLGLLALTVAYTIVIQWAGFTITTFLFLALSMLLLNRGRHKGFVLVLATVLSLGGYFLFVVAFETRFPAGPFETALKGLF